MNPNGKFVICMPVPVYCNVMQSEESKCMYKLLLILCNIY